MTELVGNCNLVRFLRWGRANLPSGTWRDGRNVENQPQNGAWSRKRHHYPLLSLEHKVTSHSRDSPGVSNSIVRRPSSQGNIFKGI